MRIFRIEGLRASQSVRDITITATAQPVDSPGSATVSDSVAVTVDPSAAPLSSPTNFTATSNGTGGVNLAWQAPAAAPAGIKYDVWRGPVSGFRLEAENTRFPERVNRIGIGMTDPNFSDTAPLAPGAYYYRVTAVVNGSDSTPSNEVTGIRGGGAVFADMDMFEDRDQDGTHDNSIQAEQLEAASLTKFTLVADNDPTELALVLSSVAPTATVTFNFDATKFNLFHDAEQTQPIATNTPLPLSSFGLTGPGMATLYGAATAAGSVTGGLSITLGSGGGTFSAFVGGMLGEQAGSGLDGGGETDGDGNQPLTDRDNFNFFTDTLVIGFGGHTQSEGKNNPDTSTISGAVWNVDKKAGVYEIGQFMKTKNYMVTLFPEDPGNDKRTDLSLCGDGVVGIEKNGTRSGGALDFLVKAVNKQHPGQREAVRKVALFGYSHGGGSVEILAAFIKTLMEQNTLTVGNKTYTSEVFRNVSFLWAGYIDAVDVSYNNGNTTGQHDALDAFPGEAGAFFNIFQDGGLADGELNGHPVTQGTPQGFPRVQGDGRDTEIDTEPNPLWPNGLTHLQIDNDNDRPPNNGANTVQELLLDHFDNYVIAPDGT